MSWLRIWNFIAVGELKMDPYVFSSRQPFNSFHLQFSLPYTLKNDSSTSNSWLHDRPCLRPWRCMIAIIWHAHLALMHVDVLQHKMHLVEISFRADEVNSKVDKEASQKIYQLSSLANVDVLTFACPPFLGWIVWRSVFLYYLLFPDERNIMTSFMHRSCWNIVQVSWLY